MDTDNESLDQKATLVDLNRHGVNKVAKPDDGKDEI